MENKKAYWLPISAWNLNDVFTTESISPFNFHKNRGFGNPVSRQKEKNEGGDYLTLYDNPPESSICLKILKEGTLDDSYSFPAEGCLFYFKTIYLKRGNFFLYFDDERKIQLFKTGSKMLLEVKTIAKYEFKGEIWSSSTFRVFKSNQAFSKQLVLKPKELINNQKQQVFDRAYNQIKGLVFGLLRGIISQSSSEEISLLNQLRKLKNHVAGARTSVSMSPVYNYNWRDEILENLTVVETEYIKNFNSIPTTQFEILNLMLNEIDDLFQRKAQELKKQNSVDYRKSFNDCISEIEQKKREIYEIEKESGMEYLIAELEDIKYQEKENGKKIGKTRKYFPKNSSEGFRKAELKNQIESLKDDHYNALQGALQQLELSIKDYQFGSTQYDFTIDDQFYKISEYLTNAYDKANSYFQENKLKENKAPNLSGLRVDIDSLIGFYENDVSSVSTFIYSLPTSVSGQFSELENKLILIAINSALSGAIRFQGEISNPQILGFISTVGVEYKKCGGDEEDLKFLRGYLEYKQGKNEDFDFPSDNEVLKNIFAFILKPNSFEQLDKFLKLKNIGSNWISLTLWSSFLGFANLPKTFTNLIFESEEEAIFESIDKYLFENYIYN